MKKKLESFHEKFGTHKIEVIIETIELSKRENTVLFWMMPVFSGKNRRENKEELKRMDQNENRICTEGDGDRQ